MRPEPGWPQPPHVEWPEMVHFPALPLLARSVIVVFFTLWNSMVSWTVLAPPMTLFLHGKFRGWVACICPHWLIGIIAPLVVGGAIGFAISVAIPYFVVGLLTYKKVRDTPQSLPLDSDSSDEDEEARAPLEVVEPPPSYWRNQDLSEAFDERYPVPEGVFESLQLLMDRTFLGKTTGDRRRLRSGRLPNRLELIHAERIEDLFMWAVYQKELSDIRRNRGSCTCVSALDGILEQGHVLTSGVVEAFQQSLDASVNEHYLWHGTSRAAADCISEDGFKIALAGSHAGTMFGSGGYFAECTSKADEYSQDDGDGIYPLLLCRVVCGEMYRTLQPCDGLAVVQGGQHDAILGDREAAVGTYREFVVYSKKQIYPEYKLLYQRVYEDDTGSE
mmetsp:Transcript_48862/g.141529  ORF Transcript_48862/g.141529 Transcript_48862/m.141529 type:complete len:389 (+) Transcript_48862:71-1237(+)